VLAIIGSGAVARAHLRHVLPLRDWSEVRVYSPGLAADPARQAEWTDLDPRVQIASSAEAAGDGADAVLLCTSSGTPVFDAAALAPGALVTSISTNVAQAHEVDPTFLASADVYCDYGATTPGAAGDMVLAAANGWDPAAIRGDLAGLATGAAPAPTGERPVYFRSIGLGLEDIFMARAIYDAAANKPQKGGN